MKSKLIKTKEFKEGVQLGLFFMGLGDAIYRARNKQGLKQEKLAEKAETTQRIISKIENADNYNMGAKMIYKIFKILNIQMIVDGYDMISGLKVQNNGMQEINGNITMNKKVGDCAFTYNIKELCHCDNINYYANINK